MFQFDSKFPAIVKITSKFFNSAFALDGLTFDLYSQGMDEFFEKLIFPDGDEEVATLENFLFIVTDAKVK